MGHGKMARWMDKFASADRNGDGSLNAVEFNEYEYVIFIYTIYTF
jgi:hypothetical protein